MKTAVYIENGAQQIVLQPENKFERNILKAIENKQNKVEFHYGSFSTCKGGYFRRYTLEETNDETLMLFIKQDNSQE